MSCEKCKNCECRKNRKPRFTLEKVKIVLKQLNVSDLTANFPYTVSAGDMWDEHTSYAPKVVSSELYNKAKQIIRKLRKNKVLLADKDIDTLRNICHDFDAKLERGETLLSAGDTRLWRSIDVRGKVYMDLAREIFKAAGYENSI